MLILEIERKRIQMLYFAKKYGFTAKKTVQCSQELDLLLNRIQHHSTKLKTNKVI